METIRKIAWTVLASAFAVGAQGFSQDVFKSVELCSYISADLKIRTQEQPCIVEHPQRSHPLMYITFRSGAKLTVEAKSNELESPAVGVTVNDKPATYLPSEKGYAFATEEGEIFLIAPNEATQYADNFEDAVKKYPELWDSLEPSQSRAPLPQNTAQGEVYHAATGSSFALMQKVETNFGPQNHIFYRNEDGYGGIDQIIDLDHDGIDELIVSTLPGCNICEIFTTWMIFARDEDGLFQERISDIEFKPEIKYDEDNIAYFEGRALPDAGGSGYAEINTAHSFYEKYVYESYSNAGRVEYRENEYLKTEVELELRALFDRDEAEESFNAIGEQQIQYSDGSNDYNLQCEVRHSSIVYNIGNCTLNGVALDPDMQNPKWTCARIGFVAPKSDDEELRLVCNGNQTEDVATLLRGAQ